MRRAAVVRWGAVLVLGAAGASAGLDVRAQTRCPQGQRRTPAGCVPLEQIPPAPRPLGAVSTHGRDAAGRWERVTVRGAVLRFRWIPPGRFMMGSPLSEAGRTDDEGPEHEVELTRGFWLGETEVTRAQWYAVMEGRSGRSISEPERPVHTVSWDDAQEFLRRANRLVTGANFRLPTEAEWEYAARAGSTAATHGDLGRIAWYRDNAGDGARPVAGLRANRWGLYDMLGNVWEWCADWEGPYTLASSVNPTGPASGSRRIIRGGSWIIGASGARAACRYADVPTLQGYTLGFRVARGP